MSNDQRANYLYLYDLPKETTNSNQIALIIKEKTGYVLELKPQIRRELNRPFCTAIVSIQDKEAFESACKNLRYFVYDEAVDETTNQVRQHWARGLPFDNSL